jgi:hypothetical protein
VLTYSSNVNWDYQIKVGESTNHYYHYATQLDQFRVWNRVPTDAERDDLYNAGAGR